MFHARFTLAAVLCAALTAQGADLAKGTPQLKSAGALAFGPNGLLFVGDAPAGTIFAIDTGDRTADSAGGAIKVEAINEKVAGLLHAAEAASDGIRKLDALMRRRFSGKAPAVVGFLTSAQLDLALNRPNVIHAALLAGPASETVLARCRRLERFRTGDPPPKAAEAAPDLAGEGTERV